MASLRRFPFLALASLLSFYIGLEYAGFRITLTSSYVNKVGNSPTSSPSTAPLSTSYDLVPAQVERLPLCAVSREEDLATQSENQTALTRNLLLTCPGLADATHGSQRNAPFTLQLHTYLKVQLQRPHDKRLTWVFFLKNRNLIYSHSPRTLEKFLPPASTKLNAIFLDNDSTQQALGLFAIRVDQWSVDLLRSVIQLLEKRPDLTDGEALTLALPGLNPADRVVHVPQWWLDIGSTCVEESTWEARFGISYVATTDQLCCVDVSCRDVIEQTSERAELDNEQTADLQKALNGNSGPSVEHAVQDFWKFG